MTQYKFRKQYSVREFITLRDFCRMSAKNYAEELEKLSARFGKIAEETKESYCEPTEDGIIVIIRNGKIVQFRIKNPLLEDENENPFKLDKIDDNKDNWSIGHIAYPVETFCESEEFIQVKLQKSKLKKPEKLDQKLIQEDINLIYQADSDGEILSTDVIGILQSEIDEIWYCLAEKYGENTWIQLPKLFQKFLGNEKE